MAHLQEKKLINGCVAEKKGYLYWVLYPYVDGVRKQKWVPTSMKAKGNKTKAKNMLPEVRREWTNKLGAQAIDSQSSLADAEVVSIKKTAGKEDADEILFLDWIHRWLEHKLKQVKGEIVDEKKIDLYTYSTYAGIVSSVIEPYFRTRTFTLAGITRDDIREFYNKQKEERGVSVSTLKHYNIVIRAALNYAVVEGLIVGNPAARIPFQQQEKFKGKYYRFEEVLQLFKVMQGCKIEIPTLIASFYGMRRSEVIGLKWSAFDFTLDRFEINHTVTQFSIDGELIIHKKDKAKTSSSIRTYPIIPYIKERLLALREQQDYYRKLCGNSYLQELDGYVCVDEIGDLLKPSYITSAFPKTLVKNGLRKIRFHDLRHTCVAILMAHGVPIEQIQKWVGHSEIGTTTDIYGHLEFDTKIMAAEKMASLYNPTWYEDWTQNKTEPSTVS